MPAMNLRKGYGWLLQSCPFRLLMVVLIGKNHGEAWA